MPQKPPAPASTLCLAVATAPPPTCLAGRPPAVQLFAAKTPPKPRARHAPHRKPRIRPRTHSRPQGGAERERAAHPKSGRVGRARPARDLPKPTTGTFPDRFARPPRRSDGSAAPLPIQRPSPRRPRHATRCPPRLLTLRCPPTSAEARDVGDSETPSRDLRSSSPEPPHRHSKCRHQHVFGPP